MVMTELLSAHTTSFQLSKVTWRSFHNVKLRISGIWTRLKVKNSANSTWLKLSFEETRFWIFKYLLCCEVMRCFVNGSKNERVFLEATNSHAAEMWKLPLSNFVFLIERSRCMIHAKISHFITFHHTCCLSRLRWSVIQCQTLKPLHTISIFLSMENTFRVKS